ncbi:MAG: peptidoglycan DD-metalloendopeptidase family protein [Bacteroidales bacterium]|nr:peptidoglycan DD-metalloendopeptidase family protein [Bacteroidales bacterium]
MFKSREHASSWLIILSFIIALYSCGTKEKEQGEEETQEMECQLSEYGICLDSLDITRYTIERGEHFASILSNLGFTPTQSEKITGAISSYLSPSRLQIGNTYSAITEQDTASTIRYLVFEKNRTDFAVVEIQPDTVLAYEDARPVTLKREYAEGVITSSMWNAIVGAGAPALLALKLSDVYAWQIDFFDVKEGDSFRVMYDVAYINDTSMVDVANIEGAVFTHRGEKYRAIPFQQDSVREYFDESGNSLRKEFLKAPLDFIRISSRFSNARFHPVLKRYRPHHGVDYAAPTGTPVKTIGDGVVIERAYQGGGAGNYVKVRHNSVYTTTYMHLSRFASGIQKGATVKQGQVIGYVGSTGLSTGPHLDFRVHKNNQPVNPLTIDSPPCEPVKPELLDSFRLVQEQVLTELDSLRLINRVIAQSTDSLSLDSPRT